MQRTKKSLYYLAGYLIPVGLSLMLFPLQLIKLLFSTREYDDLWPRLVGVLLLSLGIMIVQFIRMNVEKMYTTTMIVRSIIAPWALGIYFYSKDPVFLVVAGVVGSGLLLTSVAYARDRKEAAMARVTGR